jgi:hypothetical protein
VVDDCHPHHNQQNTAHPQLGTDNSERLIPLNHHNLPGDFLMKEDNVPFQDIQGDDGVATNHRSCYSSFDKTSLLIQR